MEYTLKKPKLRKRLRQAKQVKRIDSFSRLPDELIVSNILSRFTLEEVARYSILSRRWKNLWGCTIGSKLIFAPEHLRTIHVGDITELLNPDRVGQLRPRYHPTESIDNRVERLRACFERWISNVMQAYSMPKLDELTVRFPFDFSTSDSIDMWLECALKKGVTRLELNLCRWTLKSPAGLYSFPKLERFQGMLANCGGLYNLKDVELKYIYVYSDVIELMVTHFPLERLCMEGSCSGKISIVSDSLKRLELIKCHIDLKISASSLISLKYTGPENSLHLDHVPNLSELSVDGVFCRTFVPSCFLNSGYISGLKTLEFEMSVEAVRESMNYPLEFPETLKLEELKIGLRGDKDACFLWPVLLIQAAPFLRKFSVVKQRMVPSSALDRPNPLYHERVINIRSAATRVRHHQCLKTIELQDYYGSCPKESELVQHLLCVSEILEQIIVSPTNICPPYKISVIRSKAEALTSWLPSSSKAKLIVL
ncbi:putative F-box/FBD/LRR-repeat protein At4g00315 [Silene latifolia]|uniref:putative F-box/FBD/LRR-repeat protein At4g00315 n=1 Tax=Silene latifolia TaxID=37657 RepID=UPI003D77421D